VSELELTAMATFQMPMVLRLQEVVAMHPDRLVSEMWTTTRQ